MRKCFYLLAMCLIATCAVSFMSCHDDDYDASDAESNGYVIYSFDIIQSDCLNFDVKAWLKDYLKERGVTDSLGTIKLMDITKSSEVELYIITTSDKREAVEAVLTQMKNDTATLDSIVISKGSGRLFCVEGACTLGTTHSFKKVFSYAFRWPVQDKNIVSDVVGTYTATSESQEGYTIELTSEKADGSDSTYMARLILPDAPEAIPAHYFRTGPRVTITSDGSLKTYNGTLVMTSKDCSTARFLLTQLNDGTSTVLINNAPFLCKH